MSNTTTASFSSGRGGGIYSNGAVTLTRSPVKSNTAPYGGGIDTSGGPVLVLTSTIAGNTAAGGGMVVDRAVATLRNSAVPTARAPSPRRASPRSPRLAVLRRARTA